MRNLFYTIKDAIDPMRYGNAGSQALYWFIRIGSIALPILILLAIAGTVYCKIKGIEINFGF